MKTILKNTTLGFILLAALTLASCERVAPNHVGVLMEDYGKNGKSDFSLQKGRVSTVSPGTELFQVPLYEQRAIFETVLKLKAADNTEFTSTPSYSYSAIENRAVDLVFQNKHLGSGDEFMKTLESDILEANIYDILKDESRAYVTDTLMANGGSLRFENSVRLKVAKAFEEKGLSLKTFTAQLEFSEAVKKKIDTRNEVNTNVSVLDQQILEQEKINKLAELRTQENLIKSRGITPQLLQQQFIAKWDGKTALYGNMPVTLFKNTQ
jgi:hypothetical protein